MRLFINLLYLSGGEIASKIVTFAAIAYLGRVSGPVSYGYVEFAGAVLLCAGLIVDQGFSPYGAREIAKAPERTMALVSEIVVARFLLAFLAYLALIIFVAVSNRTSVVAQLILIYGLSLFLTPLMLQWVFQGHTKMQTVAGIQVIRQAFYAIVIFAFIRTTAQLKFAAIAEIVGVCAAAAFSIWAFQRQFNTRIQLKLVISKRLFQEGVPIGLSQMFWMIRMYGATVIFGLIATAQDVGLFGSAMRILIALHAFVYTYFFNLLPSMAQAWQKNTQSLNGIIGNSLSLISWAGLSVGMVWVLIAPMVMKIVYGTAFAPAGVILQWLAGIFVAALISGHYRYGLIAAGFQTLEMAASAVGAVLAVILIPVGYIKGGPTGAAIGLFAVEVIVWWAAWWMARKRLSLHGHLKKLAWPLSTGILVAGIIWLIPEKLIGVRILVAIFVMVGLALICDRAVRDNLRHYSLDWKPWVKKQLAKRAHNEAQ